MLDPRCRCTAWEVGQGERLHICAAATGKDQGMTWLFSTLSQEWYSCGCLCVRLAPEQLPLDSEWFEGQLCFPEPTRMAGRCPA